MGARDRTEISLDSAKAVIFDMDGVVTDTATVHARAWKTLFDEYLQERAKRQGQGFQPFDPDEDYRRYVDGKPRYDGVSSFLEARGISLPYGHPDDEPGKETVCGLGNQKNEYFLQVLRDEGIDAYQSSIAFIERLRARGMKTAVISSSRNCEEVLQAAGVMNLFDAKVDGIDMAEAGLTGKPEPDIFQEAAKRLGVKPETAVVVEDALAGVEAGRKGGFGLVIGIARHNHGEELKQHGADLVVGDLAELQMGEQPRGVRPDQEKHSMKDLPSALNSRREIFNRLHKGMHAIFLDYDGTLTPIVEDPDEATLSTKARAVLERLAEHYTVAIISGRDLQDVKNKVGLSDILYAGSHGFDIAGPGDTYRDEQRGQPFLPALDRAERRLREDLSDIPGARIDRKRFSIAVHYRTVDDAQVGAVEERVDHVAKQESDLRKSHGKKVFEIEPNVDWDKGKAVLWLLERLYMDGWKVVPLFIGDDLTDENAFRAIGERGITIAVGVDERETAAEYSLRDTEEVLRLLEDLVPLAEREMHADPWTLVYEGFEPQCEGVREALCTLGNGYFATRGAAPEAGADDVHYPGTYVAGCYNRLKSEVASQTIENESLVNVPNWLSLTFKLGDGDWFRLRKVDILDYSQELNLRRGVLTRLVRFADDQGRKTRLTQRRFVSMADPHIAALETTIVAENWAGEIRIRSGIDGRVTNDGVERYRELNGDHLMPAELVTVDDETISLVVETSQSHIRVGEAARTRVIRGGRPLSLQAEVASDVRQAAQEFLLEVARGEAITIEKVAALYTSRDHAISECGLEARKAVQRAGSFDDLLQRHLLNWEHLWKRCRLTIDNSRRAALVLHLHIFHVLQTVSPATMELDVGIPPRGLHGEAYRGHILWDELFVFPFLNFRMPDLTRALLGYRYRRLPEARWAARRAGYAGAMYPWQSGSNGREESQTLHLNPRSGRWIPDNSHLQRHVSAAIAYNVWLYYQVTSDVDFLGYYGAEMLLEIARFWSSIAEFNRSLGRYEIRGVMGPDEYHEAYPDAQEAGLNNNAYTNVMAVWVICRALEALDVLAEDRRQALWEKLSLSAEELEHWDDVSRKMRIPFHEGGIISQFEGYEELEEFDWEGYRNKYGNIQRLDRILEAEGDTPNRHKVSKQADVLMLFYLFSAEELRELFGRLGYELEDDAIPRNIDYYMKRTSHGSTLSQVVHSWVLARSKRELSWHLFKEALESDVSDIQGGTTAEGIHLGAMAGTIDVIQRCYTGLETRQDMLWLNPFLPNDLSRLRFDIRYRGHWIGFDITQDKAKLSSQPSRAAPIDVGFRDQVVPLESGETIELPL